MNWGKSIVLAFVLFAGLVITMVTISMKQDVNLVAHNYYEEELAYEDQMNRIRNFENLSIKPTISRINQEIILEFPAQVASEMLNGEIHFFRPSDGNIDKKIKIELNDEFRQSFPITAFSTGMWKTKLKWKSESQEFFFEQKIVL